MLENITNEELAYLAGIFDGEGSFYFNLHKWTPERPYSQGRYYSWGAEIANNDKNLLEWIKSRFGGNLMVLKRHGANVQIPYRLMFRKSEFLSLLPKIMPYLIVKKRRAELLLEFASSRKKNPRNTKNGQLIPNPYSKRELEIIKEVYALNQRGKIRNSLYLDINR
jgi:hypothetical protein